MKKQGSPIKIIKCGIWSNGRKEFISIKEWKRRQLNGYYIKGSRIMHLEFFRTDLSIKPLTILDEMDKQAKHKKK